MKFVSIAEIEYLVFRLAKETMDFIEPIPAFSKRFPDILESCLASPLQGFARKTLYSGLISKAAILFYLLIKNHPFQNGNKRIAMTTLFVLLYKNKKWLRVDNQELYNFARWVAESNSKLNDDTVGAIETFLSSYMTDLK